MSCTSRYTSIITLLMHAIDSFYCHSCVCLVVEPTVHSDLKNRKSPLTQSIRHSDISTILWVCRANWPDKPLSNSACHYRSAHVKQQRRQDDQTSPSSLRPEAEAEGYRFLTPQIPPLSLSSARPGPAAASSRTSCTDVTVSCSGSICQLLVRCKMFPPKKNRLLFQ